MTSSKNDVIFPKYSSDVIILNQFFKNVLTVNTNPHAKFGVPVTFSLGQGLDRKDYIFQKRICPNLKFDQKQLKTPVCEIAFVKNNSI